MMNNLLLNKDGSKKQRGSNYTPREQTILLELVKKNMGIIENKETNAMMCSKKREAWDAIAQRYNAMAVTGPRDWMQLRNLYENLKQRRKRKILRESMSNSPDSTKTKETVKRKNADILSFPPSPDQQLHVKDIDQLNEEASRDMKEKSCAEDEAYASALADMITIDKQVQAMASPKIDPLQFGIELTVSGDDMETITVPAKPLFILKQEIEEDSNSAASSSKEFPDDISKKKKPENETCCRSAKEEYYKQKLKNAKLERKFLLDRHKMEKVKYSLELEILKLQRQKLL